MTFSTVRGALLGAAALTITMIGASAGHAQDIATGIASYQAGVICPADSADLNAAQFVARTLIVPAVQGMAFGVRAQTAQTIGTVQAQVIVSHPPMGAGGITQQSFTLALSSSQAAGFYYRFDSPDELVTGTWRIAASANGVPLYSIDFDVVVPDANDGLLRACGS